MLVAVEASGDLLGANLMTALRERLGESVRFVGVGGPRMSALGLDSPFDPADLAVLGVFNALAIYPRLRRRVRETAALAVREKPDAAILIDAWGFCLRVARALRRSDASITLIKYVAPQVWATRPGRARVLARAVDHALTIHTFDAPYFEAEGLPATFVGNPAIGANQGNVDPARFRRDIGVSAHTPILLVLPGSRRGEIARLMPPFKQAVLRLMADRPQLKIVVAAADPVAADVKSRLETWPSGITVIEGDAARDDAMRAASVALACSGTVTTELARAQCPMVVAYRLDSLTAVVARRLIRTPYITLINIAARGFVAPEFVQEACTGEALAAAVGERLDDPALRARQIVAQSAALQTMRGGVADPSAAAAEAVLAILRLREPVPRDYQSSTTKYSPQAGAHEQH